VGGGGIGGKKMALVKKVADGIHCSDALLERLQEPFVLAPQATDGLRPPKETRENRIFFLFRHGLL
jgi:hypothetical protein